MKDISEPITHDEFPASPKPDKPLNQQPEWRMNDSSKMLELVQSAEKSTARRDFMEVCAEVDDMYERRPPDDPHALNADGLAWTTNVDWGGTEFGIDSAIAPEFNLLHMPDTYIKLETNYKGYDLLNQKRTVEREDRRMLDEWEEWIPELGKMLLHRKKYGLGIFYFRDPRSWHFQTLHPANLLTDSPYVNPARWSWFAIPTKFDIPELMRKLDSEDPEEDEKGFAKKDGWNRRNIRNAILAHSQENGSEINKQWFNDAETWRHEYLTYDLYWGYKNNLSIPGYIVYVKEYDGKVSEYLLTNRNDIGFLFRRPKKQSLDCMSKSLCMFPENCAQTVFREIRGYGIKNMSFFDAENQMNNRMLDSAFLSSSLLLQGGTPDDLYQQQEVVFGPYTMLPGNLQIAASQMPNTAQQLLPMMQHLQSMRLNAAQATGGEGYGHGPDRETAKAATIRFQQGQRLQNYSINFLYKLAEKFHRARFARYMGGKMIESDPGYEERKIAIDRMMIKGVTEEFLSSIDLKSTAIARIFGDGDPARLFTDLMDLMPSIGAMTEDGKAEFFRDAAHAKVGHDRAVAYFGDKMQDPALMHAKSKAQLENGHLETSDARIDASGDDNHLVHAGEHVQFLESKVAAMQQGAGTPEQIFETLSRAMAHIGFNEDGQPVGGHIMPLFQDPAGEGAAQDISRRMADLVNLRRQIGQQLEAQRASQQEKQLQDLKQPLEEQAKAAKVQQQMAIDARKAEIEIAAMEKRAEFEERQHRLKLEMLEEQLFNERLKDADKDAA